MEIRTKGYEPIELISITGRVDSVEAPRLAQALESAHQRGKYKIVVDMSQLEYMSSAGFRALGNAQRNSRRHHGEVVLAQVPSLIREALEIVGFTEHFRVFDTVSSALEFASDLPAGDATTGAPLPASE